MKILKYNTYYDFIIVTNIDEWLGETTYDYYKKLIFTLNSYKKMMQSFDIYGKTLNTSLQWNTLYSNRLLDIILDNILQIMVINWYFLLVDRSLNFIAGPVNRRLNCKFITIHTR